MFVKKTQRTVSVKNKNASYIPVCTLKEHW